MAKEIKISIKDIDKLEFYLDENAEKGDWINLNSVNEIDLSGLKEKLETKKQAIIDEWKKEAMPELTKQIINDFKANNENYKALVDSAKKLETIKEDYKKDLANATAQSKAQIDKLEAQINTYKANEAKNEAEFKNKVNEEIKAHKKEIVEDSVEYKELQNKNKDLIQKNEVLTATNNTLLHAQKSTKWVGEQLEQWIIGQYQDKLSLSLGNNASFEKATENIKDPSVDEKNSGTKPDFIFSVYDVKKSSSKDANDLKRDLIEKVVIEAKNEAIGTPVEHQVKNSKHFQKLEDDRIKNNAKFAILVTELEKDKDFSITLPDPIKYPHMFMVRPEWLTSLLSLLYYIIIKEPKLTDLINKNEKLEKNKGALRKNFDTFREKILNTYFKRMNDKLNSIKDDTDQIVKKANSIKDLSNEIINNALEKIKQMVENFDVDKMCTLIDKIEEEEEINNQSYND